jgi:hypothetical protein
MTFDRTNTRTSRHCQFDVESLGERIVPAHIGVMAAGGHIHLNLIERLPSGGHRLLVSESFKLSATPIKLPGHPTPIIVTAPVTVNALMTPKSGTFSSPIKAPGIHGPIIVTAPVAFNALMTPKSGTFTSPVKAPGVGSPIIVTAPVTFNALASTVTPPAPSTMLDNVSQALITIYEQYEQNPAGFNGVAASNDGANHVLVQGDEFGITVHDSNPNEFQSLVSELNQAGMTTTISSAADGLVIGMLPISDLLTVANFSPTLSITPEMTGSLN